MLFELRPFLRTRQNSTVIQFHGLPVRWSHASTVAQFRIHEVPSHHDPAASAYGRELPRREVPAQLLRGRGLKKTNNENKSKEAPREVSGWRQKQQFEAK